MTDLAQVQTFEHFYAVSMRSGLFSGFLTISGFLFSAHTFIIAHMKKEIYEKEQHRVRVAKAQKLNKNYTYYGSLRNLSRLLMGAVVVSLCASVSQFTLGLHETFWAAVTCISIAGIAVLLLSASIFVTSLNLKTWFDDLEEQSRLKSEQLQREEQAQLKTEQKKKGNA